MSRLSSESLARFLVTRLPAVLHTRSDGAAVAGIDRNLRATRERTGNSEACWRHHSSGSVLWLTAGREKKSSSSSFFHLFAFDVREAFDSTLCQVNLISFVRWALAQPV